ncbi:hypothetical protein [Spirulina sp. CS-785/01]|uniref:hypothetical protein n=1 Tax=Spirulina sp. CS-785/01 TaxID=3021716 RepID=UPI002FEE1FC2
MRELTIAGVLRGVVFAGLLGVGIIWSLELVNVPTSSILAGGAILGLALSFGAQSLVKDLVNGC